MTSVKTLRALLEQEKTKKNVRLQDLREAKKTFKQAAKSAKEHERALEIVKEVGLKTQQQIQYHISDITSMALEAVFPEEPYELVAEFVERRNKTECDLYFQRNGNKVDPLTASGGGAVDVASFALRIASWAMRAPRSRNTIILDEPLRFVSADKQEKASMMIKEISQKLGIQFLIVTHNETLTTFADKTFQVSLKKGVSKVEEKN